MSTVGNIHSVETFGALDGPGLRYIVFLQGCPLQCLYCHNPDSWDPADAQTQKTALQVVQDALRYKAFIKGGGITLSGGEPLLQADFCEEVIDLAHKNKLKVAIDTSGAIPLTHCIGAVEKADLLLLDIKAFSPELCKKITGQSNQNALEILNFRQSCRSPVWIRHVVVPGLTLNTAELTKTADYLAMYPCVERVELLPFHKMGEYKWEQLKRPYALTDTPTPTPEELAAARKIFADRGLPIK